MPDQGENESLDEVSRNYGAEFEEEVKSFLEDKFKFKDVKKNFHIAPKGEYNEVDVCGRFENILFVFQCRAAGRRSSPNLREKILATQQRSRVVLNNYRNIPEYKDCKFVIFIFITKKINVPEIQIRLLEQTKPKIWYADEKVLEYYADLYDKIGKYAVYNFLADFNLRPSEDEQLHLTALKTKLGDYNAYLFYVRPKHLLKFAYVARRRSKKEDFYQRMLEKSRIKNIQSFLDSGGIFPTNLIMSIREGEMYFKKLEKSHLPEHVEVGILNIKSSYNACWIIDGQHRLYSYARSNSNEMVPCIAFDNMSMDEERGFFISINKKQKPIQADLLWDLAGKIMPRTPSEVNEWIISNSVRKLYFKEPFLEKIYIPVYGSKAGKIINMAAFCNGISNSKLAARNSPNCVGMENPLYAENSGTMVNRISGVLERYFNLLNNSLSENHKNFVFGNAGIPVLLYLLEPIVAEIGRIASSEDLRKYTNAIKLFFDENFSTIDQINQLRIETTSEGSRKNFAKQIGLFIRKNTKNPSFWPKMEELDYVDKIIEMERRIGRLIADKLFKLNSNWEKQRIPEPIYVKAHKQSESDGTEFHENFDLGDEKSIILRKDNWAEVFKQIFIGRDKFHENELEMAFLYLSKIRNPKLHGKSFVPSRHDLEMCTLYLQKLNKIIPNSIPEEDDASSD